MSCGHCYIGRRKLWKNNNYVPKAMTLEQFDYVLPQLVEAGVTRMNFGGGESPLHKDFTRMVQKLRGAGITISLVTNGSTLPKIRPYLSLFNDIGVSLDFPDKRHSENRGREKAYDWAISCMRALVASGKVKTEMVTCIMSTNYDCLPELYDLAQKTGVDMWRLNRFHATKNDLVRFSTQPSGLDMIIDNSHLACSPEQMKVAFEYLASITPREQNYTIPDPVFRTFVSGKGLLPGTPYGRLSFRIKTDGGVVPNIFTDQPVGNVFNERLKDILNSDAFKKYNGKAPEGKCQSCINVDHCRGGDITDTRLTNSNSDPYCFLDTTRQSTVRMVPLESTNFIHESYLGTIYVPVAWRGGK